MEDTSLRAGTLVGGYITDANAFLFRLQYNGSSNPLKFPVSQAGYAGNGSSNYGPTFGAGHDIHTFSGTINKSGTYFPLNGYVKNIGNSYNLNGQNSNTITNGSLQVTDLEVYRVIGEFINCTGYSIFSYITQLPITVKYFTRIIKRLKTVLFHIESTLSRRNFNQILPHFHGNIGKPTTYRNHIKY